MRIASYINQVKYNFLLNRYEWKEYSLMINKRDNFECINCESNSYLNSHHLYYINGLKPWEYPTNLVVSLCNNCHEKEHMALDALEDYYLKPLLDAGILAIDIWKKLKNNETIFL